MVDAICYIILYFKGYLIINFDINICVKSSLLQLLVDHIL